MLNIQNYINEKLLIDNNINKLEYKDANVIIDIVKEYLTYLHYDYKEDYNIVFDSDEKHEAIIHVKFMFEFPEPKKTLKSFADEIWRRLKKKDEKLFKHTLIKDDSENAKITFEIMKV